MILYTSYQDSPLKREMCFSQGRGGHLQRVAEPNEVDAFLLKFLEQVVDRGVRVRGDEHALAEGQETLDGERYRARLAGARHPC